MPQRSRFADLFGLALFLVVCLGTGALGAALGASGVETWYADLVKPTFNPPDEAFVPVWIVLYILMAVAAWRVWRSADPDTARWPLALFTLQLAINLGWNLVFFNLQKIGAAVATVIVLDVAILVTMLAFRTVDRLAAFLMAPYLAWVAFCTVLNIVIWRLNPPA
jgi:benzodiazapine receptor